MILRSLAVGALTWVFLLGGALTGVPWLLLTGAPEFVYAEARLAIRGLLALAGVRLRVRGREHIPTTGASLYMANHQSNLDPPILLAALPGAVSFLAKRELFRVPLLGWVMRSAGLIALDRGDRAAAAASMAEAAAALRGGRPFLIFPEGTRSPDGRLQGFKKGAFFLAEQAGAPIVPVAIQGSGARLARGRMRIRPGEVTVTILPALLPEDFADAELPRQAISDAVWERIARELAGS